MTGTTLDRPTPTSVSTSVEPRTGAHAVARTLADTAADAAPAVRTPSRPCPHAAAAAEPLPEELVPGVRLAPVLAPPSRGAGAGVTHTARSVPPPL